MEDFGRFKLNIVSLSEIPISCEGCGSQCCYCGMPPFEGKINHLPDRLRQELIDHEGSRSAPYIRCLWLDDKLETCKYREHRPDICKDFVVGGAKCLEVRDNRRRSK